MNPTAGLIVAIASTRKPKVEATRNVLRAIGHFLSPSPAELLTLSIDGGIEMPRTMEELLTGAEQRVLRLNELLQSEGRRADYLIGMEGGFHTIPRDGKSLVFLQSWAYVSNGKRGCFGSSGNIAVPDLLVQEVMARGRDLGAVIDEVAQQRDIRSNQGTWGILTRDLVRRQASFETALLAAFAPFYNSSLYGEGISR